jgi:Carboxypeptidase regulatory-like domain/TonB dependent receptor-like, beta-barrel
MANHARYTRQFSLLLTAAVFLLCPLLALAQTASIQGRVTDPSGALVPGATVVVTNVDTGVRQTTTTNAQGVYTVPFLQPGNYSATVSHQGFDSATRSGIKLVINQIAGIDFTLQVGSARQTVSVSADAEILQTEDASVGQDVDTKTVSTLPLNGRDYTQLVTLAAGAAPNSYSRAKNGFTLNGSESFQNTILLDGIDNNNYILGADSGNMNALTPSVDAIQEFKLEESSYGAQYGRAAGGVVIVTIKSGANAIHGSAFEYLRNDALDANDFFANRGGLSRPPLRRNQYGGTFGGPIVKNRSFFFVSYQGERQTSSTSGVTTVPTPAMVSGNFNGVATVYNPYDVVNGVRQPFPNDTIPASMMDPAGMKLAALYPAPNLAGLVNNYAFNQQLKLNADELDSRFDEQITQKDSAFFRYSRGITDNNQGSVFAGPGNGGSGFGQYPLDSPVRAWSAAVGETHVFSPTVVNEFHAGYTHLDSNQFGPDSSPLFDQFGIGGVPPLAGLNGLPEITIAGYSSLGSRNFNPNPKRVQVSQLNDTVSMTRGAHNIKAGLELLFTDDYAGTADNGRGSMNFNGQFTSATPGKGTGSAIADLLLGQTNTAAISTPLIGHLRSRYWAFFVDDTWRVTSKLTLDLGARYDLQTPLFDRDNRIANFDLDPASSAYGTLVDATSGGVESRSFVSLDKNNIAPRVGLAYQLTPKTVIRSAFGIFYGGLGYQDIAHSGAANPPYFLSVSIPSATNALLSNMILSTGYPAGILTPANLANPNLFSIANDFPMPATDQWNLSVERQLPSRLVLTVGYVGSSTSHLMGDVDLNAPPPGPGAVNPRRPFPQYGSVVYQSPFGHSTYNGLQTTLQRRFSNGFSLLATYTYSHSLDNVLNNEDNVGGALTQNPYNTAAEKASSGFDIRHRFVANVIYDIPLGRSGHLLGNNALTHAVLGGWQVGGIFVAQGGHPLTLGVSPNPSNTTTPERPDRLCNGNLGSGTRSVDEWFDTSCFALPAAYTYGNSARGVIISPGLVNLDGLLVRSFAVTERVRVDLRAEAFNLTNSAHFGAPNLTIGTAQAGKITSTASPNRELQFALRVAF